MCAAFLSAGTVISYAQTDVQRMGPVMVKGFATIDNVALINVEGTGVSITCLPISLSLHARCPASVPSKVAARRQHSCALLLPLSVDARTHHTIEQCYPLASRNSICTHGGHLWHATTVYNF